MTMRDHWRGWMRSTVHFLGSVVAAALLLAAILIGWPWWFYTPPVHRAEMSVGMTKAVVFVNSKIGLPIDVRWDKECLTQSMFQLVLPDHDEADHDGRDDHVILGNANTGLTELGEHHIMLWFDEPRLPYDGDWEIIDKVQFDCGASGNESVHEPKMVRLGIIHAADGRLSP